MHDHHPGLITVTVQLTGLIGCPEPWMRTDSHKASHCGILEQVGHTHTNIIRALRERERKNKLFSAIKNRMSSHLSTAVQEARRQWKNTFEEEKLFQPRFLYPARLPRKYN